MFCRPVSDVLKCEHNDGSLWCLCAEKHFVGWQKNTEKRSFSAEALCETWYRAWQSTANVLLIMDLWRVCLFVVFFSVQRWTLGLCESLLSCVVLPDIQAFYFTMDHFEGFFFCSCFKVCDLIQIQTNFQRRRRHDHMRAVGARILLEQITQPCLALCSHFLNSCFLNVSSCMCWAETPPSILTVNRPCLTQA